MRLVPALVTVSLAACAAPQREVPSLAPRAAEAIDPRLAVGVDRPVAPADAALGARLAGLLGNVHAGDEAFNAVAGDAERLAAAAGAPQSESWIAAQQALSALEASRAATTRAVGDIDALGSERIATGGGIAPADVAAIEAVAAQAAAIDGRQAALIVRLQARLGS